MPFLHPAWGTCNIIDTERELECRGRRRDDARERCGGSEADFPENRNLNQFQTIEFLSQILPMNGSAAGLEFQNAVLCEENH